jgi:hypothetical protein
MGLSLVNLKMCELGNQFWLNGQAAKEIFELMGVQHVSMDINGQNGALPIDLRYPVPDEFVGKFDVVTDFGCSEHVDNPYEVNRNIYRMAKIGGLIIQAVPYSGTWAGHCLYRYRLDAFTKLAEACKNRLQICNTHSDNLLWVVMMKTKDNMFPTVEEFDKLDIIDKEKF